MSDPSPIERLKRYVYLHLAIAGMVALALGYTTMSHPGWERILVPLYMLALAAIAALSLSGGSLRTVEWLGIGSTALYFLIVTTLNLHALGSEPGVWPPLLWGGLVYLFAYILLPPRTADTFNFVYLLTLVAIGLPALLSGRNEAPMQREQINDVLQIFLANMAYLWVTRIFIALAKQAEADRERARLMQTLVNTDSLTGVLSRKRLLEEAEEALRALQPGRALSFVLFDLDNFKEINDRYGHPTGDVVLVRCAKRARHGLRDGDRLGRLGGEEFGVLLPDTELSAARRLAERLRASLEAPADEGPDVTASFGVVQARPGWTLSRLLTEADRALYQAKRAGKNRVVTREDGPDATRDPVQKV